MDKKILTHASKCLAQKRKRMRWRKLVTILAAIVVFCTTYALILPAITLESKCICEKEEHKHTDE